MRAARMSARLICMTNAVHCFEKAGLGEAPFRVVGFHVSKYQACPGAPVQAGTCCDYCGTGIMNVYEIQGAGGRAFKVGCDCVAKTGDAGLIGAVKRMQREARKVMREGIARERFERIKRSREEAARARRKAVAVEALAFAKAHNLIEAFKLACRGKQASVARDMLKKLRDFGSMSPNAVTFVQSMAKACSAPPAPSGKVTFKGTIVSTKSRESQFGVQYKMVVESEEGWKVWTTIPAALFEAVEGYGLDRFKGLKVEITCTLERSKDDPSFAFGKRPRGRAI